MHASAVFTVLVVAAVVGTSLAVDCRRYAFAPACRGIMLKRSATTAAVVETSGVDDGVEEENSHEKAMTLKQLREQVQITSALMAELDVIRQIMVQSLKALERGCPSVDVKHMLHKLE